MSRLLDVAAEPRGGTSTLLRRGTPGLAAVSFSSCTLDRVPKRPEARMENCPKRFGSIGTDGRLVIAPAFESFVPDAFREGVARVESSWFIDREGNQVWRDTDWW